MMNHSETVGKISAALVKAQKNIGAAVKDSANPFFKSKYADLGSVMETCKDPLNEQGIAVRQPLHSDETGYYVTTELRHESGEFFSSTIKLLISKPDMQQVGAAATYARRYGLQAMMFIPCEDDDGESAAGRGKGNEAPKAYHQEQPRQTGPSPVIKPKAPPTVPKQGSGLNCYMCGMELILSTNGQKYFCPNWSDKKGEHQIVAAIDLETARAAQVQPPVGA